MRYCSNQACDQLLSSFESEGPFCRDCGTELTPLIRCLCSRWEFNPRLLKPFCSQCGATLDAKYLGRCMAAQLQGMVGEIAKKSVDTE